MGYVSSLEGSKIWQVGPCVSDLCICVCVSHICCSANIHYSTDIHCSQSIVCWTRINIECHFQTIHLQYPSKGKSSPWFLVKDVYFSHLHLYLCCSPSSRQQARVISAVLLGDGTSRSSSWSNSTAEGIYSGNHLDPPRGGAKWMGKGAIKQPPLGFKHHPLEGPGTLGLKGWGRGPRPRSKSMP